jgi:hypothetical protein
LDCIMRTMLTSTQKQYNMYSTYSTWSTRKAKRTKGRLDYAEESFN